MAKFNQKFWKSEYYNEEKIKEWYKNYKTYLDDHLHTLQNENEIKQVFLKGEKREIENTITSKKEQEKIYKFMKKVIVKI